MSIDVRNPFDFERPVKDPKLFAGRREELDEIDYYLQLMLGEQPTYHNLSTIGERAAGKTSLLNRIQYMAEKKGLLAVKISLNNENSQNEVFLFKELYDAILTSGVEKGMFEGVSGKVYRLYRKTIDMLELGTEIPFLFGTAYVGAKKNNTNSISQSVIISDLKKMFTEAKKHQIPGIVILLDECDLLASNQTLLQKLRNVFSDIDGFVLIFSGTEKMFPSMTETFSPLPRIFKRINVQNFKNVEETKECILNRLSEDEKKLIHDGTIGEIHFITNGNPYEVQLISHFMYKNFKKNKTGNIIIDTVVLDDVMNELERLREGGHHNIANYIKRCNPDQIKILKGIMEFPNVTLNQLLKFILLEEIDSIEIKEISNKKSFYKFAIEDLLNTIIIEDNKKLRFAGDQFDVLYLKYHLLSNGIKNFIFGNQNDPDINLQSKLNEVLLKGISNYRNNSRFDKTFQDPIHKGVTSNKRTFGVKFEGKPNAKPGEWTTIFSFNPQESDKQFYLGVPNSFRFRVNCNFLETGFVDQILFDNEKDLETTKNKLNNLKTKLEILGIEIILVDEIQLTLDGNKLVNAGKYQQALELFDKAITINHNYDLAWANKGTAFFLMKDYGKAFDSFKEWSEIRSGIPGPWESLGKCCIHLKRFDEALEYLNKASKVGPELWSVWDNKGRALLNLKKYDEAIKSFERALELKTDDYDALFLKGMCFAYLGKDNEVIQILEEFLNHIPNNLDAIHNKAFAHLRLDENEQALQTMERIGQKIYDSIYLMETQSLILDKLGKIDEAIDYCNKIIEKEPSFTTAWYNRSCFKVKLGNIESGIEDLKKAIELDKDAVMKFIKTEHDFDKIRDDPRFKDIIAEKEK